MPIRLRDKLISLILILTGGLLFSGAPLLGQYTIDLTDGLCSDRFLSSAIQVAESYSKDLGAPEHLSELIDSSFVDRDYISTITYLFIAHKTKGLDDKYLADIATVFKTAGCFRLSDSLYRVHLSANPRDSRAIGNHALLLSQYWKFKESRELIEHNLRKFKGAERSALLRDLGMVRISEFIKNKSEKALEDAFKAFRESRINRDKAPTTLKKGIIDFVLESAESSEPGKYRYTLSVEHAAGSDLILTELRGRISFGKEMNAMLRSVALLDLERLLGEVYLAPGDKLKSELGAFEVIGDMGEFAPFYDGSIELEIEAVFPDGSRRSFRHNQIRLSQNSAGLGHIASELFYGNGEWACSLMAVMEDTGAFLPPLWRESAYLATALEDSIKWVEAIGFVDSMLNKKIHPNLWVYRGALDYLLGNFLAARHPLEQALSADPKNFWAMHNLALVEYELGNLKHSAELLVKTAELNPEMSPDFILAGVIYEELGENELALKYMRIGHSNSAFRAEEVRSWIRELEQRLNISSQDY